MRTIGIDPGTDHVGVSVIDYDLADHRIILENVFSLSGSVLKRRLPSYVEEVHGAMYARLKALRIELVDVFSEYMPHRIIVERPFFNSQRPSAFSPLVKSLTMVQQAVATYCPTMCLREIDPASAKKRAGVKGNSGDKSAVNRTLIESKFFENPHAIDYAELNEHEADSVIIGYYDVCDVRNLHLT